VAVNRIEVVIWTTWLPDEDEQKELRRAIEKTIPTDQKAWVETEVKERKQ
jgi:hypothetical protein